MPGMPDEIEIKFRVPDLRAVRRALRRERAGFLATVQVSDEYFDTPEGRLLAADSGVRLRRTRVVKRGPGGPAGPAAELTYKGAAARGRAAKVRREVQTGLADGEAAAEILGALGFVRTVLIEKRRSSYRLGGCLVELDELPLLGTFVEIEGPNEGAITRLAGRLGLAGEPIRDHYIALLIARCGRVGTRCATVTVKGCPVCRHRPRVDPGPRHGVMKKILGRPEPAGGRRRSRLRRASAPAV